MQIRLPNAAEPASSYGAPVQYFTGREPSRQLLARLLATKPKVPVPLVVFHGSSGVGKSALGWRVLAELRGELPEGSAPWFSPAHPCPAVRLDLTHEALTHDPIQALQELRDGLKVECPRFDLALAWLRRKLEAGDGPALWRTEAEALASEAVDGLEDAAPDDLPSAHPARFATTRLAGVLRGTKLGEWFQTKEGCSDFVALRELSPATFSYRFLLERLADDLHKNLPSVSERACRLVVILDSFERIRELSSESAAHEGWVRELYECLGAFTLILVLSRSPLRWAEHDKDWGRAAICEQHALEGLSATEAHAYLQKYGVDDPALREKIQNASADKPGVSLPLSLGLGAQLALEAPLELPDSNVTTEVLLERLLGALPADKRKLVEQLALTPRFDHEAFLACTILASRWEWLLELGFIHPIKDGWYRVSAPVQELIRQRWRQRSGALVSEQEAWLKHWQSRIKTDTDAFSSLTWYHLWCLSPDEALVRWKKLVERERSAGQCRSHIELLAWWEPLHLEIRDPSVLVEAEALAALGTEIALLRTGSAQDNLIRSARCHRRALSGVSEAKAPRLWAMIQSQLGDACTHLKVGDRAQNLARAASCYEGALRVYTRLELSLDAAQTRSRLGGVYADLPTGDRRENLVRAIACHQAALHTYTEEKFPEEWAFVQSQLGRAYSQFPEGEGDREINLARARSCYQAAARIFTQDSHPIEWATLQEHVSLMEWLSGKKDEAKQLLKIALEVFQRLGAQERVEQVEMTLQLWEPQQTTARLHRRPPIKLFLALMVPLAFMLWGALQLILSHQAP